MKPLLAFPLLAISAQTALAAEPSAAAKLNYLCAGVAGLSSQLLEKSDPQVAGRLGQRAQALAQSGVAVEVGRQVKQSDAIVAMSEFLRGRAAVYRTNPALAVSDLNACRARNMIPAGPTFTAAQVAAAAGAVPPPANPPAPSAPVRTAATPARAPATGPDAEFRRFLIGPWGKMLTGGTQFTTEMIMSSVSSRAGAQFTRKACPDAGLASPAELLGHEFWFETKPNGDFGISRASGDPGKINVFWQVLTYKDQPAPDTYRYEFYHNFAQDKAFLTLKRLGPDRITHSIEVPSLTALPKDERVYGRCRKR